MRTQMHLYPHSIAPLILPISSWCHNDVVRPKGLKRSAFQVDPLQGDVGAWRLHGRQGLSGDYQGQPWKEDDCCFTKGLSCCFDKNNWQLRYSNIWNTYGNINVISFDAKVIQVWRSEGVWSLRSLFFSCAGTILKTNLVNPGLATRQQVAPTAL